MKTKNKLDGFALIGLLIFMVVMSIGNYTQINSTNIWFVYLNIISLIALTALSISMIWQKKK